jgi:hydrogenase maturation protease
VASAAVRHLPPDVRGRATVEVVGALGPEQLVALPAVARVVIVDAVVGPPPGRIVRLDLAELASAGPAVRAVSSHQLPLGEVVTLAQLLRDTPLRGKFVGLAIASVTEGATFSDAVRRALPQLRLAIADVVRCSLDDGLATAPGDVDGLDRAI